MYTIFNREPFTPWIIAIIDRRLDGTNTEVDVDEDYSYEEFDCFYRTGFSDGKECEIFTMILKETNEALLQLKIFKDGDVKVYNQVPYDVSIYKSKNRIEILPLVYCRLDTNKEIINFEPIEGYNKSFSMETKLI